MAYTVRPARPSEHALLPEIERRASVLFKTVTWLKPGQGEPASLEFIDAIARSGAIFVAADDDDIPVGFTLVSFLDRALYIYELDVAPPHGRHGLGRRLVDQACAFARTEGAPAVTLSTFREVPWNRPFYEKAGFHLVPRNQWIPALHLLHHREVEIGLPVDRRCFMRKELAR